MIVLRKLSYFVMKQKISFIVLLLIASIGTFAQTTISYGQISSYCPQTGQTLGGGGAIAITFYDGYISHPLYGKLYASQKNNDGSTTYVPETYAGSPAMQLNAVLVSADYQRMEERMTTSIGYASMNMINSYTSMGEDGGRAALNWANANAASKRGSSSSSSGNDYIEVIEYATDYTGNAPYVWCEKCQQWKPRHSHIKKRVR